MKGKSLTEELLAFALRQAESGVQVVEICRKMNVSEATFYRWKNKFKGIGVAELHRMPLLKNMLNRLQIRPTFST
jgi:putative transposase